MSPVRVISVSDNSFLTVAKSITCSAHTLHRARHLCPLAEPYMAEVISRAGADSTTEKELLNLDPFIFFMIILV
jgi:hypothetical protein